MSHTVIEMNCPGCGARVSTGQSECEWCHKPIIYAAIIDRRKILYPFSSNNKRVHRKQSAGFIACAHEIGFRRIDIAQFGKPTAHKGVAGGLYLFVLDKKS